VSLIVCGVQAYTAGGSFAEYVLAKAEKTVKLPDNISTKTAATVLVQGLTGELLSSTIAG